MGSGIDSIVNAMKDEKSSGKGAVLLTGAGCSVEGGIPDTDGLFQRIQKELPQVHAKMKSGDYHRLVAELAGEDPVKVHGHGAQTTSINWAHIAIALLMKERFIDRVLTVNFDSLARRACDLIGLYPPVYDCTAATVPVNGGIPAPSLWHLHGQFPGAAKLHSKEGQAWLHQALEPVFRNAGKEGPWIVVGYRGENDPVFELLKKVDTFEKGLFWIGLDDADAPSHVQEGLLNKNKGAVYLKGHDADSFLVALCRQLGVFPPEFVARPFTHLQSVLGGIAPYPVQGRHDRMDLTQTLRSEIQIAIDRFEDGPNAGKGKPALSEEQRDQFKTILAAQGHLLAQDADRVIDLRGKFDRMPSPEMATLLYWSYVMKGDGCLREAESQGDAKATQPLLKEAAKFYASACQIQPAECKAFYQWGRALMGLARQATENAAVQLFTEAGDKFQTAVKIHPAFFEAHDALAATHFERGVHMEQNGKPAESHFAKAVEHFQKALALKEDLPQTLFGLGRAMVHQAESMKGGQAVQLFAQAMKQFETALKFQPEHSEAFVSWGHVLMTLAENMDQEDGDAFLAQAQEKYAAAVTIQPDHHEAHASWGKVLWLRGTRAGAEQAEAFFTQAMEKFQAALSHNHELSEAFFGWGEVLFALGTRARGEKGPRLLQQAVEKYRAALEIDPDHCDALNAWGNSLFFLAKHSDDQEAQHICSLAAAKYQEVLSKQPRHSQALTNWGNVFLHLSQVRKDQEQMLLNQAAEKYRAALDVDSQNAEALSNWGNVLFRLAQRKDFPDTKKLYKMAEEKYRAALAINPTYIDAFNNLGWILTHKAINEEVENPEAMFNQASDNFQQAVEINPNLGSAYINWGTALMEQAKTKKGINVHPFLANARKKLLRGEELDPGSGSYQLARLMALLANETGCREWLEKSKQQGVLPHSNIWMNEPDFDSVRESKWFQKLILEAMSQKGKATRPAAEPLTSKA